jgi:hypothetical protein
MKRFFSILICVVCVVAFIASGARAGTVTINSHGLYEPRGGYNDGEFVVTLSGLPGLPNGVPIHTFCVEMTEYLSIGATYNAAVNTAAIKGSAPISDPLGPQAAWLYWQYYTGNIVINTGAKATDFQYALWKLEDEDTQAPAAWATITWTPAAQAYYNMAMASNWTDIGPVRVLNLGNAPAYANQDLLIPEPATIALLGFGVLGLLKKRRA